MWKQLTSRAIAAITNSDNKQDTTSHYAYMGGHWNWTPRLAFTEQRLHSTILVALDMGEGIGAVDRYLGLLSPVQTDVGVGASLKTGLPCESIQAPLRVV